jgi:hypothetical protein
VIAALLDERTAFTTKFSIEQKFIDSFRVIVYAG